MKMKRKSLAFRYRQQDLKPLSFFISYCSEQGVSVNAEELEWYDKQALLLPAIRLSPGYNELRKVIIANGEEGYAHIEDIAEFKVVNDISYYIQGSVSFGGKDWLNLYQESGVVTSPAETGFKPWSIYSKPRSFTTNLDEFENNSEPYYSVLQILPLKFIQNRLSYTLKNASLLTNTKGWEFRANWLTEYYSDELARYIRPRLSEYAGFLTSLGEIRDHIGSLHSEIISYFDKQRAEVGDFNEALLDAKAYQDDLLSNAKPGALALLKTLRITTDDLESWRGWTLTQGTFGFYPRLGTPLRKYLSEVNEETLTSTEAVYSHVEAISTFLQICGAKPTSVKQLLLASHLPVCTICLSPFTPSRNTGTRQKVCSSRTCQKERRRLTILAKRSKSRRNET